MNGLAQLGNRAAGLARAVVPDPFVIAILLSGTSLLIAATLGSPHPEGLVGLMGAYANGMFQNALLAFAFQMALVLVTGHALADAPPLRAALAVVSAWPKNTAQAAAMAALFSCVLGLLNWGLALVGGAFLAREIGRTFQKRGTPLNYPLVGAAAYLGLLVWHGGLSGSAPLAVASAGIWGDAIDVSETLFTWRNAAINANLVGAMVVLFFWLGCAPDQDQTSTPLPQEIAVNPADESELPADEAGLGPTLVAKLEHSPMVTWLLAIPLAVAVLATLFTQGTKAIQLNIVIALFLVLGLFLNGSPRRYGRAFADGARGAAGILLQFPLYFGILGVVKESGLLVRFANLFADLSVALSDWLSPEVSASWFAFLSAAFINLLVPSGGGQWALQAPVLFESADRLSLARAPLVMAFSYGDQLTNMLQPFWALPLLSITGLRAKEIFGYTLVAMCIALPLILFWLAVG